MEISEIDVWNTVEKTSFDVHVLYDGKMKVTAATFTKICRVPEAQEGEEQQSNERTASES